MWADHEEPAEIFHYQVEDDQSEETVWKLFGTTFCCYQILQSVISWVRQVRPKVETKDSNKVVQRQVQQVQQAREKE